MTNATGSLNTPNPGFPLRKALERFYLRVIFKLRPKTVYSLYGPKFRANYADATFRSYVRAEYGYYLADLLEDTNRPFTFLDVGANQGLYSLLAARNPHCRKVWAFEPVKRSYELLRENVALNKQCAKIDLVNAAISDVEGTRRISIKPSHSGVASLEHAVDGGGSEPIECISYQALQETVRADEDAPILVKIDTEGHEPTVIGELRKSNLWPKVTSIFFEVDTRWFDDKQVLQELLDDGFVEVYRTAIAEHYDVLVQRS